MSFDIKEPSREEIRARLLARFGPRSFREISIGDGWLPIVDKLDREIAALAPNYEIAQVKEKFGGLRYYVGGLAGASEGDALRVYDLIRTAERASYETCEDCGATEGAVTDGPGWLRTLCKPCRAAWIAARVRRFGVSA